MPSTGLTGAGLLDGGGGGICPPGEPGPPSDEDLARLRAELQPRLRATLARFRIPREDAEDLVQTAFVNALVKWHEIR